MSVLLFGLHKYGEYHLNIQNITKECQPSDISIPAYPYIGPGVTPEIILKKIQFIPGTLIVMPDIPENPSNPYLHFISELHPTSMPKQLTCL